MDSLIGYEDRYLINKNGEIFNKKTMRKRKSFLDKRGYFRIVLYKNNKPNTEKLHRLIAIQYIKNDGNKPCVNHKNSITSDNSLSNLEWCTQAENMQHAWDNKRMRLGKKDPKTGKFIKNDYQKE